MRVATWNMKQAVAPKKPLPELWDWLTTEVAPDVAVLTEAKVPNETPPPGWDAIWVPGGIGPRRRWGTVVAGRGVKLAEVKQLKTGRIFRRSATELAPRWPAAAIVADVMVKSERWATIVGIYGLTVDANWVSLGDGSHSIPALMDDLAPLFRSDRRDRIILAGDFNLLPNYVQSIMRWQDLIDLTTYTADDRGPLPGCSGCDAPTGDECGHFWTHRNGNSPNAAVQQIDFIYATPELADELKSLRGGVADFPDAWDVSDHAPLVAEFG